MSESTLESRNKRSRITRLRDEKLENKPTVVLYDPNGETCTIAYGAGGRIYYMTLTNLDAVSLLHDLNSFLVDTQKAGGES